MNQDNRLEIIGHRFDKVIFFFCCWIFFFTPISTALVSTGTTLGMLTWIVKKLYFKDFKIKHTPVHYMIYLYLISIGISTFLSIDRARSINDLKSCMNILIFFIVYDVFLHKKLKHIFTLFNLYITSTFIVSIPSLMEYFSIYNFPKIKAQYRISGFISNPITFAELLIYSISILLPYIMYKKRKSHIFMLIPIVLTCILTLSRMSLFTVLVILLLNLIHKFKKKSIIPVIILGGSLLFSYNYLAKYTGKDYKINSYKRRLTKLSSHFTRKDIWKVGIHIFKKYPYFGSGYDTSKPAYIKYLPEIKDKLKLKREVGHFHNQYLNILVEQGIFGFVVYMTLILYIIFYSYKLFLYKESKKKYLRSLLALILFNSLFGIILAGVTDLSIDDTETGRVFFFYVAFMEILRFRFLNKNKVITNKA